MNRILVALLSLVIGAGCVVQPEGDEVAPGSTEDAILGGHVERGYPAVGILRFKSGGYGSGALIAPNVVLTAGHVAAGPPTQFFYGTPEEGKAPIRENLKSVAVVETLTHACYRDPSRSEACHGDAIDVALVRLAEPIEDVAPLPVVDRPLEYLWGAVSPYEDDSCIAVGFGANLIGGKLSSGTRRSAASTIEHVGRTELETVWGTGIATSGDSGGPLLCQGKIVGVVRGSSTAVPKGSFIRNHEGYERLDLWRSWIASGVARLAR